MILAHIVMSVSAKVKNTASVDTFFPIQPRLESWLSGRISRTNLKFQTFDVSSWDSVSEIHIYKYCINQSTNRRSGFAWTIHNWPQNISARSSRKSIKLYIWNLWLHAFFNARIYCSHAEIETTQKIHFVKI